MKWYEATVYKRVDTGEVDATRNPVFELRETEVKILVRTAPMAPRHDSTKGNQFDAVERTFLTKARSALVEDAAALKVRGVLYEVERISSYGEPIAISVKRFK